MIEKKEGGREGRKYFIGCEEKKDEVWGKEVGLMVIEGEEEKEGLGLENKKEEKEIEKVEGKGELGEKGFGMEGKWDIGEGGKIVGLGFGRKCLLKKVGEGGVLFGKRKEGKEKYIDGGYLEMKEKGIGRENEGGFVVMVVVWREKGVG